MKIVVSEKRAKEFNDAALKVMNTHGVEINNLYEVIGGQRRQYQLAENDVHYNDAGKDVLAAAVTEKIMAALRGKK